MDENWYIFRFNRTMQLLKCRRITGYTYGQVIFPLLLKSHQFRSECAREKRGSGLDRQQYSSIKMSRIWSENRALLEKKNFLIQKYPSSRSLNAWLTGFLKFLRLFGSLIQRNLTARSKSRSVNQELDLRQNCDFHTSEKAANMIVSFENCLGLKKNSNRKNYP